MKEIDNFYNIFFVVHQLNTDLLKKIDDYETLIKDSDNIKKKFYNIEFVYMHSIILDMAKLTSSTKSDKSGIKELEKISPSEIKKEITVLLENNSEVLEKIRVNRNKIIAHIDVSEKGSYMNLGFSEIEISRKIDDYVKYLKLSNIVPSQKELNVINKFQKMKASSLNLERYSPSDFYSDLPVFKEILKEIIKIADNLNYYFYKNG